MKRSLRVALYLAISFVLFVSLSASIQRWIVYPQFQTLEKQDVQRSAERLQAALNREIQSLENFISDYAEWDDAWDYMEKLDPVFLLSNFSPSNLKRNNYQLIWLIAPDGAILYHASYNKTTDSVREIPADQRERILTGHPFLKPLTGPAVSGFMPSDLGPTLVVAHPVLTTAGVGPPRGVMAMGRVLDESFAKSLSEQIQLPVELLSVTDLAGRLVPDVPSYRRLPSGEIEALILKSDWFGEPAFVLQIRTPPEITALGRRALIQSVLAVIGQGMLFLLISGLILLRTFRESHKQELDRLLEQRTATLRETEEYLKSIMDTVPVGIVIVAVTDHRIMDINPAALKMLNARKDEVVGQICHLFICPAEVGHCPITDLGKSCDRAERLLTRSDGASIPILKTVVPTYLMGRECLLECFVDIRDQKEAEERIQRTMADMARMNRAMVGREDRVLELKQEVNRLLRELGRSARYHEGTTKGEKEK